MQAHAREEYKLSVEANDRERQRKLERKRNEQQENAVIMQQAIALRQKQDQVCMSCMFMVHAMVLPLTIELDSLHA